jgi:hypothetical protein
MLWSMDKLVPQINLTEKLRLKVIKNYIQGIGSKQASKKGNKVKRESR